MRAPWLASLFAAVAGASILFHALPLFGLIPFSIGYSDVAVFYLKLTPDSPYFGEPIEYPALVSGFIRLMDVLSNSHVSYYFVSAITLALIGGATTFILFRMAQGSGTDRRFFWHWLLAPSLLVFLVYNWDIIAIFFVALAFFAMRKNRDLSAAVCLALAASAKLYPLLYLLPLLLRQKNFSGWLKVGGTFAITALAINIPFAIHNFSDWSYFYRMNQYRPPNLDSIWGLLQHASQTLFSTSFINGASTLLLIAGGIVSLWILRRSNIFLQCFALTLLFLLVNKVLSPQYVLWLLPFFALLPLPSRSLVWGLEISNFVVLFSILPVLIVAGTPVAYFWLAAIFVIVRHLILAYMLWQIHHDKH